MPTKPRSHLALALMIAPVVIANGCGTIVTLTDGHQELIYSGIQADSGPCNGADLPFSLVADTLVLPYTIPKTQSNRQHASQSPHYEGFFVKAQ